MSQKPLSFESYRGRAANGHRKYSVPDANGNVLAVAGQILAARFGFGPLAPAMGFDDVITECSNGDIRLLLGWDNWSGFYIMADSAAGDPIVDQFGDYFDGQLRDPAFQASCS